MKRRLPLFTYFLFCLVPSTLCQSDYDHQLKYWFHRWRLTNDFLKMGDQQGDGCIATTRHPFGYWNEDIAPQSEWQLNANLVFGDQTLSLGYYIAVLGTEYELLKNSGRIGELERTKTELYYAMETYRRLDFYAETFPYNSTPKLDGFFRRDDVPVDYLDSNLHPDNLNHFNSGYTDWSGDPILFITSDYQASVDDTAPPEYHNEPSFDQITGLLMGFRIVKKVLPNQNLEVQLLDGSSIFYHFRDMASDYTSLLINKAVNDNWAIKNPEGDLVQPGAWAPWYSFPIAQTGNIINDLYFENIGYYIPFYGYHDWVSFVFKQTWMGMQNFNFTSPSIDFFLIKSIKFHLAAISNSWRQSPQFPIGLPIFGNLINTTEQKIYNGAFNEDWHSFFGPLWAFCNDQPISSQYNGLSRAYQQMQEVRCRGIYAYDFDYHIPGGWNTGLKWNRRSSEQFSQPDDDPTPGQFPGLDFMLLHNLYYLTNSAPLPSYESHSYMVIDYPLTLTPPATVNLKESFFSIEAKDKIPASVDATLRAGYEVHLSNGFHAEQGTSTHIYTDPFSCSDDGDPTGGYKNGELDSYPANFTYGFRAEPEKRHHATADYTRNVLQSLDEDDPTDIIVDNKLAFSLYPNPTNDGAYIETMTLDSKCTIEVKDVMGRLIASFNQQNSNRHYIDLSQEPTGMYLVTIFNGSNIHTERLIKK